MSKTTRKARRVINNTFLAAVRNDGPGMGAMACPAGQVSAPRGAMPKGRRKKKARK